MSDQEEFVTKEYSGISGAVVTNRFGTWDRNAEPFLADGKTQNPNYFIKRIAARVADQLEAPLFVLNKGDKAAVAEAEDIKTPDSTETPEEVKPSKAKAAVKK